MDRRTFLAAIAVATSGTRAAAQTAAPPRPIRVGILALRLSDAKDSVNEALMRGFRDLGYVPDRNIAFEFANAAGQEERLPELAADLVRRQVDVILIAGPAPLDAARRATRTIPLIMIASSADPVAEGIAASLARPGGNVTGLTYAEPDRFKKELELLKSVAVDAQRVGVLWDFDVDVFRRQWQTPLDAAARTLRVTVDQPVRVRAPSDLPATFATMKARRIDAILVASAGVLFAARGWVADLAIEHRLPAIAAFKEFTHAGLLMSYGPDIPDINRRAAGYVDRIARGAKPGDLPIEMPSKFELFVNMKTARLLGLSIPQDVLLRADHVIQ